MTEPAIPSLGARIAKGTLWTVAMRWAIRLLSVISIIILARVLTPEDYGIVAQAVMVYSVLETMTAFGLENAIIRDQRATRNHYDTVWTIHILRGLAIAFAVAALASPAASFFRQPELEAILYVYALISIGNGLINVGIVDFRKDLKFHLDFRYNVWRKLSAFLATIASAFYFQSYWAFVVGTSTGTVIGIASSFYMSSFRPRLALVEWRSLFDFSKWVLPESLVGAVSSKIDTFILGRLAPAGQLGLYTVSHEISGTASTELSAPLARAMMPGLSRVNDDPEAFRDLYLSAFAIMMMVAVPASVGLSALSETATLVLLGDQWTAAGPIIMVLALYGLGRAVTAISASAYVACGRVDLMFKLSVVGLVVRTVAFGLGYWLAGFWGLVWGALLSAGLHCAISLLTQRAIRVLAFRPLIARTWRIVIAAATMWLMLRFLPIATGYGPVPDLALSVTVGGGIYIGLLLLLWWTCNCPKGPEQQTLGHVWPRLRNVERRLRRRSTQFTEGS